MPNILIIGGGIGGLATAACLHKRGIHADIYERATELRELGAALGVWPNATRVLAHLGVLDVLQKRAHVPPAGALRNKNGRVLKQMAALQSDAPTIFAHRADLHHALLSAIPPDRLHLNKSCTRLERNGPFVRVHFADGDASPWADGLIGADGLRSVIRDLTLNDGPPIHRGYVAWRGVASFPSDHQVVGETWGTGQRFGFIPLGSGRVGWWATANKSQEQSAQTLAQSPALWKSELLKTFAPWHAPIPELLAQTPESAMLCHPILDRPPTPPPWGEGPLTLLGDAAHPTTPNLGQGACMAIEDAAVIAQALAAIPDITTAFRVYEQTRTARTSQIVRDSLKFGRMGQWTNPIACALRNALLTLSPESAMRRQFRALWLYDAWNTPLCMPT